MALGGSDIIVVCILAFVGLLLGSIFVYIFFYAGRRRRLEVECEPMLQDLPEPQLLSHSSPPSTVNLDAARKLVCADSAPISTLSTTRPPTETLSDLHRLPSSSFAVGVSHSPSGSDIPQLLVGRSERRHSTTAPPPLTRSRLRVVNDVESAAINVSRKKDKPDEPRRTMMSASKKAAVPAGKGQRRPRSRPSYVANASVFDLDDVMSSQTTSTLPPSYRSRRSTINPAFNLRYLLSTSHQTGRVPRGAATPLSSEMERGEKGQTESGGLSTEAFAWTADIWT
ncbi:hypothetical protein C8Q80DRAFT_346277 [Daedaleopsis nitida]|nr:hypothetical protein C8Q80DRAFT_346277 [Daedaleopsis nitida]